MGPGKEVTIDVIPEERGGVCNGSPAMADVCRHQPPPPSCIRFESVFLNYIDENTPRTIVNEDVCEEFIW